MSEKTLIDRVFGIPRGAESEFTYRDETEGNFEGLDYVNLEGIFSEDDTDGAELVLEEEDEVSEDTVDFIETPVEFAVIQQTVRRSPSGMQVVDVLVEVEDIVGAQSYEFQVTKV